MRGLYLYHDVINHMDVDELRDYLCAMQSCCERQDELMQAMVCLKDAYQVLCKEIEYFHASKDRFHREEEMLGNRKSVLYQRYDKYLHIPPAASLLKRRNDIYGKELLFHCCGIHLHR